MTTSTNIQISEIPMAPVINHACWPVTYRPRHKGDAVDASARAYDVHTRGPRAFGSSRDNGARRTVGVTIWGAEPFVIAAPLAGQVLRFGPWADNAWIVYLRAERLIFGIGGMRPHSWENYGLSVGDEVNAGAVLGAIGKWQNGVHFQTWDRPRGLTNADFIELARSGALIWRTHRPPHLLDPTEFLIGCGGRRVE